ncbi:MAG: hypothetical protein H7833_05915 [Magnetococcus sp. DMHC-1]
MPLPTGTISGSEWITKIKFHFQIFLIGTTPWAGIHGVGVVVDVARQG